MTLTAAIGTRIDGFTLDCTLAVNNETLTVLGPNGAGKTTLIRVLAGLLPLQHGRLVLNGAVLDDPLSHTWTPPERRHVGVVFQDVALFPHLSAVDNVAFGLRTHGVDRAAARERARIWLRRVGVEADVSKRPAELSGGTRQRVALARALIIEPRLLLLDEPLAAVDAAARRSLQDDLRTQLQSFDVPRIVVTHDWHEAAALGDRAMVLENGRVTQTGALADITAQPASSWTARLVRGSAGSPHPSVSSI